VAENFPQDITGLKRERKLQKAVKIQIGGLHNLYASHIYVKEIQLSRLR
jgi:hypothetical protein